MNRKPQPPDGGQPDEHDLEAAFQQAMDNHAPIRLVDLGAAPHDLDGIFQVCACGLDFLHDGRCARCAARKGPLICGKENNHRGPHQAIAIWRGQPHERP